MHGLGESGSTAKRPSNLLTSCMSPQQGSLSAQRRTVIGQNAMGSKNTNILYV